MCATCGCEADNSTLDGRPPSIAQRHPHHDLHALSRQHEDDHAHPQHTHAAGISSARRLRVEQDILAWNDAHAQENRRWLAQRGVFALNLVSSPGSGKTTLLTRTIEQLRDRLIVSVVEGDQQTDRDAERIRATGAKAVQINTGKGCHLEAHMVQHALARLAPPHGSVLMIENVGNLVCPAAFDLGEAHKVVVLSVTEGEDKPLKYPDMFHAATLMLLNKIDLLPYVSFDVERCIAYAMRVNPRIQVLQLSATRGEGMEHWLEWIEAGAGAARGGLLSGPAGQVAQPHVWTASQDS